MLREKRMIKFLSQKRPEHARAVRVAASPRRAFAERFCAILLINGFPLATGDFVSPCALSSLGGKKERKEEKNDYQLNYSYNLRNEKGKKKRERENVKRFLHKMCIKTNYSNV